MNSFPLPGAPVFHRSENGALMIEDLGLDELAQEHGTPLFVYSQAAIESALSAWQRGLAGRDALVCYAVKANSSQAILSLLAQAGCGFDIVSGGELARALAAGAEPGKIVFSGVGKTRREMQAALEAGIGCFNVESEAELLALNDVAAACGLTAPVSIRFNPDVDAASKGWYSLRNMRAPRVFPISVFALECRLPLSNLPAMYSGWNARIPPSLSRIVNPSST